MTAATEQPMPRPNSAPSVQAAVRADLEVREQVGVERYGTPLQPHNGRDALRDAYEEALDLACYLRQALIERDGAPSTSQPLAFVASLESIVRLKQWSSEDWSWRCSVGSNYVVESCKYDHAADSRDDATRQAVEHLGGVHGIYPTGRA